MWGLGGMKSKEFKNIKWKQHSIGAGIQGLSELKDGWEISLVAGEFFYSTPKENRENESDYSSFEVALFNPNGNSEGDVLGWQSREDIEKLIERFNKIN